MKTTLMAEIEIDDEEDVRILKTEKMDKMGLKPKRVSPTINGRKRANRILITNGEFSSGIKAYEGL